MAGFFLRRQQQIFENLKRAARRRKHFRVFLAIFLVAQLPPKQVFYYTRIHSLPVNGVITSSNHALWRVLSNKAIWVLGHVVSDKLFWNWNGVVRFVSQEIWFDEGFVIWHFCNYSLVQIVSLRSLSIGVRIVFTTNVLVDRTKDFKWNASPND